MIVGTIVGTIEVRDGSLHIPSTLHTFARAAEVTVTDSAVIITQYPYVCIFCGNPALKTLNDLGVCEDCLEDLVKLNRRRYRGSRK